MRSPILVDQTLNFAIKGEHVHVTDDGGAVHLALTRGTFLANIARAKAVAAIIQATEQENVVKIGRRKH